MLFFACNNPSKNFSKDEKRINDWSKRIINSRDSIKAKDTFYSKEVEAWYKMYNKSEDKQLISKIDFINAKIKLISGIDENLISPDDLASSKKLKLDNTIKQLTK